MPTWNEFAWAAFLYGSLGGDDAYDLLMGNQAFIASLHGSPQALSKGDIRKNLVHFLNQWRTRVARSCDASLLTAIVTMHPDMVSLSGLDITNAHFAHQVTVGGKAITIGNLAAKCFDRLDAVKGFGPTATAKTLHILIPHLFVMWDGPILEHYAKLNSRVNSTGDGYAEFLQEAQKIAQQVALSFSRCRHYPPSIAGDTPDTYLSRHLGYKAPKSMAKYIDEYLWVTITKGRTVPPIWWPR